MIMMMMMMMMMMGIFHKGYAFVSKNLHVGVGPFLSMQKKEIKISNIYISGGEKSLGNLNVESGTRCWVLRDGLVRSESHM